MAQLPDGQFQPAMPLNCGEELIAGRLKQHFGGTRRIIPGRTANLTRPLPGRAPCQFRNACWLGCPFGAYFSTQSSTLPAAVATGRLTLRPFAIVTEVLYDRNKKRATGVRVLDALTDQTTDYTARVIFLCASTLNSTWLLLRSATNVWPGGLGSSSDALGHNLMDHHFRAGASARSKGSTTSITTAGARRILHSTLSQSVRRQAGVSARLRLSGRREPLRVVARGRRAGRRRGVQGHRGAAGPWSIGGTAFGEMLPNPANKVSLDASKKDKWGCRCSPSTAPPARTSA